MVFAIRGLVRGSIRQVFGVLGFVGGLWVAVMVSRWVGAQWLGARPAVVFWVSRLLVAGIAGLVVAGLFHWCGSLLGRAVQAGPAGWLDRVLGVALGASIGMAWALALVLLLVFLPVRLGTRTAGGAERARPTRWWHGHARLRCGRAAGAHAARVGTRAARGGARVQPPPDPGGGGFPRFVTSRCERGKEPAPTGAAWTIIPFDSSNTIA